MHDPGALAKGVPHRLVDDQIHIALTVTGFDVFETVVFFRKRPEVLGEQHHLLDQQGEFVGARTKQRPAHPNDVADIQFLGQRIAVLTDLVLLQIDLELSTSIQEMHENGLAEGADGHDTAGKA